jgi:hypothetical protein
MLLQQHTRVTASAARAREGARHFLTSGQNLAGGNLVSEIESFDFI